MIVTGVEQQKKDKSRFSVYIDGEYAFSLIKEDILYFKIKEGYEIPEERYDYIMNTTIYIKAQDMVVRYIGYKMRTEKEVIDKLRSYEYSDEVIEKVVAGLKKYDYINDKIYCEKYVKETLKLRPKGKFLIKQELKMKGIEEDVIDCVLEEKSVDENGLIEELLLKKYEGFREMDDREKAKIYSFLLRRGFSYGAIKDAISTLAEKDM